jgi:obg-like ATPase 1
MGKKKKAVQVEELRLGRPGNNVKMGIVGLPNVGKSLLFNLLSGQSVPSENYAFTTIDPSSAQVVVPDERYDYLCEIWNPKKRFPASVQVWDIAGLVRGAHEGHGLGNLRFFFFSSKNRE